MKARCIYHVKRAWAARDGWCLSRHQGVQEVSKPTKPFLDMASPASNGYISIYSILKNHHVADLIPLPSLFNNHAYRSSISSILAWISFKEMSSQHSRMTLFKSFLFFQFFLLRIFYFKMFYTTFIGFRFND